MAVGSKEVFSKNLQKYIAGSGKDRREIANDLGIPYSTLTDWMNGKKYPRIGNIEKLSEYFGIPKSVLIEDFEATKKDNDMLASIIVQLRMNTELLEVVDKLTHLDKPKLDSLKKLLDTFI